MVRLEEPFPHIIARNVFQEHFYRGIASQIRAILNRGLSEELSYGRFSRMAGYDAYGISFDRSLSGDLTVFTSPSWHSLLTSLFAVEGTGDIYAGAHHHIPGSGNGKIHNDFNPGWFPANPSREVRFPDHRLCDYKTGEGALSPSEKVQVFRAVAMIFYLENDEWAPGDGGETGLFDAEPTRPRAPYARIPPENNSILLFECTPRSYHAFLSNPGKARTSIIMWAHRTRADVLARWREDDVEKWRS